MVCNKRTGGGQTRSRKNKAAETKCENKSGIGRSRPAATHYNTHYI